MYADARAGAENWIAARGRTVCIRAVSQLEGLRQLSGGGRPRDDRVDTDARLVPHAHSRVDQTKVAGRVRGLLALEQLAQQRLRIGALQLRRVDRNPEVMRRGLEH